MCQDWQSPASGTPSTSPLIAMGMSSAWWIRTLRAVAWSITTKIHRFSPWSIVTKHPERRTLASWCSTHEYCRLGPDIRRGTSSVVAKRSFTLGSSLPSYDLRTTDSRQSDYKTTSNSGAYAVHREFAHAQFRFFLIGLSLSHRCSSLLRERSDRARVVSPYPCRPCAFATYPTKDRTKE